MAIKEFVRNVLNGVGLTVSKLKRTPYQELFEDPDRYKETTVQLLGRPFTVADGRSFYFSYREIFVDGIYRFQTDTPAPRIIDCGSNYGTSIAYFKHVYPTAIVTGIEADAGIFKLLSHNTKHLDVKLINKAVSSSREPLTFFSEGSDGGRAGHAIEGKQAIVIEAMTLDDLIDGPVDFLKLDIEGSEHDALRACAKLHLVNAMFIEYHSFKESEQVLSDLLAILRAAGFRYYIHQQFCSPTPLTVDALQLGMDLQLNIFAKRPISPAP